MKLTAATPRFHTFCNGCQCRIFAGAPDVYAVLEASVEETFYCAACAAAVVYEDPTRSVTQFFTDTEGTQIKPEILSGI